jgi:flagellar basal body P-ring protein FlgI
VAIAVFAFLPIGAAPKKKKEGTPPKINETVGDISFVMSHGEIKVEGVGLVAGLDNTGVDPPPSWYRKQLVDEMSKATVEKPEKYLTNPRFSMVIVRLTIPVGVSTKDRLDVQVEVPPGCGTTSLAGGYLLTTRLREVLLAGGSPKESFDVAFAQGPVMIGTPAKPNDPKVGRVLGGAKVKKNYPFTLVLKENKSSARNSKMLETVVNERFHEFEAGHQKGVANAKSPQFLELKVPTLYHQNQEHYFRVVQLLAMVDSPELRERRTAAWAQDLTDPTKAGVAAMKLEGLGPGGIETLKAGLKNENSQVRFFCAESLAYLSDASGVDVLGETAVKNTNFRVYALAALAAMDQPPAHMKLRKLMDEPEIELRYGAFNALRTLDPHDPFLGQVRVLDAPKVEPEDDEPSDAMAVAITTSARRRNAPTDPFGLYVVDSEGPPLIHISRSRRSEIVVFGRQQKLYPPVVLDTGSIFLNASDNDEKIEVSKIVPSRFGDQDVKLTTSLELAEVVRKTASLGATYPQIVAILEAAKRQKNISGELVVDAVPAANRVYLEAVMGKDTTAKHDDSIKRASAESAKPARRRFFGLFGRDSDDDDDAPRTGSAKSAPAKDARDGAGGAESRDLTNQSGAAKPSADAGAKKGDGSTAPSAAKKDDAVKQADVEESTDGRRRFFNIFRRDDDD